MLTPTLATATFLVSFNTVTIVVSVDTTTNVSSVTSVVASFEDPGVVVSIGTDTVTLSGKYTSILPIKWYWKDLDDVLQSGDTAPPAGTYLKLIQLDSPPVLTEDCEYTITSDAGTDTFTHTVTLISYDALALELQSALSAQPGP
jgi:hypothetical protein